MSRRASSALLAAALTVTLAAPISACNRAPVVLSEPVASFSLKTTTGDAWAIPDAGRDVLLYFFASW